MHALVEWCRNMEIMQSELFVGAIKYTESSENGRSNPAGSEALHST
jgi:hypothetical protein